MKIENSKVDSLLKKPVAQADAQPKANAPVVQETKAASGDKVSLSDLAGQLQKLEASLGTTEAFDTKRVEAIKDAIKRGEFSVNSDVVASKLIDSAKELLTNRTK